MFPGMINKHADRSIFSGTFSTFVFDTTIILGCWYAVHFLQMTFKVFPCPQYVGTQVASEREFRPVFISPVSMQFLQVVGIHITSLHLAVESGVLVYIGPVVGLCLLLVIKRLSQSVHL